MLYARLGQLTNNGTPTPLMEKWNAFLLNICILRSGLKGQAPIMVIVIIDKYSQSQPPQSQSKVMLGFLPVYGIVCNSLSL
jgi:hypothetical protein